MNIYVNFLTMAEKRDILVADIMNFGFQTQTKIQALKAGDGTPEELKEFVKFEEKVAELQALNENLLRIIKRR